MFTEVISKSARPLTTPIVTEWSSNPQPQGVDCKDVCEYILHGLALSLPSAGQ